ncbi:Uncharacterised protein [Bordetella pertussis]|nr:Uncharacterised protein [Bordetella pertussis]
MDILEQNNLGHVGLPVQQGLKTPPPLWTRSGGARAVPIAPVWRNARQRYAWNTRTEPSGCTSSTS